MAIEAVAEVVDIVDCPRRGGERDREAHDAGGDEGGGSGPLTPGAARAARGWASCLRRVPPSGCGAGGSSTRGAPRGARPPPCYQWTAAHPSASPRARAADAGEFTYRRTMVLNLAFGPIPPVEGSHIHPEASAGLFFPDHAPPPRWLPPLPESRSVPGPGRGATRHGCDCGRGLAVRQWVRAWLPRSHVHALANARAGRRTDGVILTLTRAWSSRAPQACPCRGGHRLVVRLPAPSVSSEARACREPSQTRPPVTARV